MKGKVITANMAASVYMFMGLVLIISTFMWAMKNDIPNGAFVLTALVGIIPVVVMLRSEAECGSDEVQEDWEDARQSTIKSVGLWMLLLWIFVCLNEANGVSFAKNICYIMPCMAGLGYLQFGVLFKCFQNCSDEEDEL